MSAPVDAGAAVAVLDDGAAQLAVQQAWAEALDELEARVQLEEDALAAGVAEAAFTAVTLPAEPPVGAQRVRAQLVLGRLETLAAQYRSLLRTTAATPGRAHSPYH